MVDVSLIRVLEPHVVNQIAAGEVVERPAAVVRELLDNALDAGATRITIELEKGGIELVRVTDDGSGMSEDQLPLAVHPHATSKIEHAEDLVRVGTMGFRGEALASIASVARVSVRSRARGEDQGAELAINGGAAEPMKPAGLPVGTSVTVRTLFFNTPARRKFLRTLQTEQQHCTEAVKRIAMSHPAIGVTLIIDARTIFDLPPGQSPRARVFAILGKEHETQYLEVSADELSDERGMAEDQRWFGRR
ncbi:MAG: DNA mismatch repair endonuclease MutL [Planctomycetota bacterium]